MRFCFIIEEQYRNDPMPMVIADQLLQWGHDVDLLEPHAMVTCLNDLSRQSGVDIVETPQGPAILDINDFPSFGGVPRAVVRVSEYVLHAASRAEIQRSRRSCSRVKVPACNLR